MPSPDNDLLLCDISTPRPPHAEKWFDALVLMGTADRRQLRAASGMEHRPLRPSRRRVIRKTSRQIFLFRQAMAVLNELLADLGCQPVVFTDKRIRKISLKDLRTLERMPTYGICRDGWVYLHASSVRKKVCWLFCITHELVHLASFTVLLSAPRRSGVRTARDTFLGLGAHNFRRTANGPKHRLLNETLTELVALEWRRRLVAKGIIKGKSAERLLKEWQTTCVDRMICLLVRKFGKSCRIMIRDMLQGTGNFESLLDRHDLLQATKDLDLPPSNTKHGMANFLRRLKVSGDLLKPPTNKRETDRFHAALDEIFKPQP